MVSVEKVTFYFDRQIGKRIPEALLKVRPPMAIRYHEGEHYQSTMPDDQILKICGKNNWVAVSQDKKWHIIEAEKAAVIEYNAKCFYLPCASDPRWQTLGHIVKRHQKMIGLSESVKAPFIFDISKTGKFKRIL